MSKSLRIFFDPEVQRLIDSFAYCFRVKITVFSPDMEELIVGLQNPGAHYCSLIQGTLKIRYRCCRQDALMCENCRISNRLMVYRCHAGLSEAVLPMIIDDTLIGYAMLGQFRTTDEYPAHMDDEWTKTGHERSILDDAFKSQPEFDKITLDKMLDLFSMMITFVISKDYVRIRHPHVVESVILWLDSNMAEQADLNTIAQAINRSPSSISHGIKKRLGISFTELASLKKIQKFESLIAKNPLMSIKEASSAVGYDDPLYFSRLYKKVRLSPPSAYVHSFQNATVDEERFNLGIIDSPTKS